MQTEIEVKFLDVNHDAVRAVLTANGATRVSPMHLMRRVNLDFEDGRLQAKSGWLRLRDEGDKTMLAYKQLKSWDLHGVSEIQTMVDGYDVTLTLLEALGMQVKSYQETRRETWTLNGVEVVLDEWPWIKPFIEIEGPSEAQVRATAKLLGFDWKNAVFGSIEPAYIAEYDIIAEDIYKLERITFEETPPEWFLKLRRNS